MKKALKWLLIIMVLALIGFALYWFFGRQAPVPSYITDTARKGDIEQTVSATGEISAGKLVAVGAQATGQIKHLYVKLGQEVKQGDLIAEIDATSQKNALNTNRAKLESYQAQLTSAQISLRMAQRKYNREKALWAENATSKELVETAEDSLASARAKVAELQSAIRQTRIEINTSEADLGYTRITSPINGTVVALPIEEGQTINSAQSSPTIAQIADLSTMLNRMQIAEGDITKVHAGQTFTYTTLANPDSNREGKLASVDPGLTTMSLGSYSTSTDTTSNAIYYYARAYVPNEDGKLSIGMTTQNNIVISSAKNVLLIPTSAIKVRGQERFVRVLGKDEQQAPQERKIEVGLSDGVNTEVQSGLQEGDKVVISGGGMSTVKSNNRMGPPRM